MFHPVEDCDYNISECYASYITCYLSPNSLERMEGEKGTEDKVVKEEMEGPTSSFSLSLSSHFITLNNPIAAN